LEGSEFITLWWQQQDFNLGVDIVMMTEVEAYEELSRKLDRVLELLEDGFLTPDELRDVLTVKMLHRNGQLLEETVSISSVW